MTDQKDQRQPQKQHRLLTMAQAQQLLAAAQGSSLKTLLLLALATGMRRGELLGLKWDDIDCERALLQVRRSLGSLVTNEFVESAPKTDPAWRQIELPPVVIESLCQHWDRQQEQRSRAGAAWHERDYVFPNAMGYPIHPLALIEQFDHVRIAAGFPALRFHDLRAAARHLSFR